ncbi:threonine/serine ThrE exporter family protein [Cellulomonas dongxiuzhuiae]|uniref:threonine/serine ThrE exporter family protein n=1 Tax=Cellulomonas dongxiuzhuiae TaxID=2819979 RepID=UPI001AAF0B49|nr:threonine/serine exporter family protein [Cellulomonas dongxiuzhuiae]MBO3089831.1 threonine/serine exporter family protein [Cellulomonas dongxiuzhuiae]
MPTEPDDDELELIRRSGAVLRVGRLSLAAGTGSYRVKASMARVAGALGIDRHQAHVTLTEITTTSHRGRSFRTEVTEVRTVGVNTDRLAELELLAQRVEARAPVTVEDLTTQIDRIAEKPPLYPVVLNAMWAAVACAAFAFLNNGGAVEVVGAFVGAGLGQGLRRVMLHRGFNQFGVTMLAATLASLSYLGFVQALHLLGVTGGVHEAGYVAAALFLVPGFPLVTGALDLAKLDFSAGVARLTWALMIFVSAAFALWAVSIVVGLSPDPPRELVLDPAVMTLLRLLASFVGVLGFALMFNSPWRMALVAAGVAALPNLLRIEAVVLLDWPPQAAAAAAAFLVGLLAAWVAPRLNIPRITVYVPAVTIMVPGVPAYRAVYYLSNGDVAQALTYGVSAALVVTALAVGLAVARMVTDREWGFEH